DPTFPLDPDSTIADIGAYWYDHTPWVPETQIKKPDKYEITCYPNPYSTAVTVEFRSFESLENPSIQNVHLSENVIIEIFDIKGKLVGGDNLLTAYCLLPAKFFWQPDRSLPSGIYFIKVNAGNYHSSAKVIYLK
ncbi:T9SS type A sorting domain-containing protein, partial [bacterium]|nr:T9SS type A sorting domain-containing protein [bacterium]